jgi:hypothetical protein
MENLHLRRHERSILRHSSAGSGTASTAVGVTANVMPFVRNARDQQTRVLLEAVLCEIQEALRESVEALYRRRSFSNDAIIRSELMKVASEINGSIAHVDSWLRYHDDQTPCLVRALEEEIAQFKRLFPDRIQSISTSISTLRFIPSWNVEFIFRLLVRTVIFDGLQSAEPKSRVSLRMRRDRDMLRLSVDGSSPCTEGEFLARISHPRRLKCLLSSLGGRLESGPKGIALRIPVLACASTESILYDLS